MKDGVIILIGILFMAAIIVGVLLFIPNPEKEQGWTYYYDGINLKCNPTKVYNYGVYEVVCNNNLTYQNPTNLRRINTDGMD